MIKKTITLSILGVLVISYSLFLSNDSYAVEGIKLVKVSESIDGNTETSVFSNMSDSTSTDNMEVNSAGLFVYKLTIKTKKQQKGTTYHVKTILKMDVLRGILSDPETDLNLYLQSKETGGSWKSRGSKKHIHIKEGKSVSVTVATNNTKWWRGKVTGYIDGDRIIGTNSKPHIRNRKASIYPTYSLPKTPLTLKKQSTKLKQVPAGERVTWNAAKRIKYIKWFKKKYSVGKSMDWSKYEIHHMKPIKYGGTNKYSNLIPLPKKIHQGSVSPWWLAY